MPRGETLLGIPKRQLATCKDLLGGFRLFDLGVSSRCRLASFLVKGTNGSGHFGACLGTWTSGSRHVPRDDLPFRGGKRSAVRRPGPSSLSEGSASSPSPPPTVSPEPSSGASFYLCSGAPVLWCRLVCGVSGKPPGRLGLAACGVCGSVRAAASGTLGISSVPGREGEKRRLGSLAEVGKNLMAEGAPAQGWGRLGSAESWPAEASEMVSRRVRGGRVGSDRSRRSTTSACRRKSRRKLFNS